MNVNSEIYRKKNRRNSKSDMKSQVNAGKLRQRRKTREQRRRIAGILFAVAICIAAFLLGGKTIYNYFQDTAKVLQPSMTDNTVDWESEIARNFDKEIINFVLFGFDRNESRESEGSAFRPDTIMIASLNFRTNEINIVNIPRDTYVNIYDLNFYDKINHSYVHGYYRTDVTDRRESGQKTLLRTVQDFLGGVPLHYYINMDMNAIVEVIDAIGGVFFNVEHQVRNYGGRGRVVIEPGYQLLSGYQYMHYVRFRYVGGDFARIDRQQDILIETFDQLRETGRLSSIPKIIRSISSNIETNISASQMASLALYGMEVDSNKINTYRFEGFDQYAPRNGLNIYYMVPDEENRVEVIRNVFGVSVPRREQIHLSGRSSPQQPTGSSDPKPEPSQPEEPKPKPEPKPEPDPYEDFDPEIIEPEPTVPDPKPPTNTEPDPAPPPADTSPEESTQAPGNEMG